MTAGSPGDPEDDPEADRDRTRDRRGPDPTDLPELRPETWPEDVSVSAADLPPIDPDRQALRVEGFEPVEGDAGGEGTDAGRRPTFAVLPRAQWVNEAAHRDAADRIRATLAEAFDEEGFVVWAAPPPPDATAGEAGEVVVGYVVRETPTGTEEPPFALSELMGAVPDTVNGVAGRGSDRERVVEIPVVVERTLRG